jgi:alpha-L-arabinofuranosidase
MSMKTSFTGLCAVVLAFAARLHATEFHVAITGSDGNLGTKKSPFRTIQHAAEKAQPGDDVTVHEGVYRERVDPPRGGTSDVKRIVFLAAPGEKVEIKGSEPVTGWQKVDGNLWKMVLTNNFFGNYNPYSCLIDGDYMFPNTNNQHTGMVYLDGVPLVEAATKDELAGKPHWFGEVTNNATTLWAYFKGVDPNEHNVEINVRSSVFYPSREQINYITVRGFEMSHAAVNWAPPTAEQVGLIGTHWSKGWVIESNRICYSRCVGITLGKFGDKFDNTYKMDSQGFTKGIQEALQYGWTGERVGHHRVCNNTIAFCGQAGIVGSMGAVFSTISGNTIHNCSNGERFDGYETAGIKFHAAIDVIIRDNHIYRSAKGIWLDWMAQGPQICGNLFHENREQDLFVEVNHGPMSIYNNLFLSPMAVYDKSGGSAYAHNLFTGKIVKEDDTRRTPVFKPHSVDYLELYPISKGDERHYNNIFSGVSLTNFNGRQPDWMRGNVFLKDGKPCTSETNALVVAAFDPKVKLTEKADGWYLEFTADQSWTNNQVRPLVTTELLGVTEASKMPFENPDGSPLRVATDYFGRPRNVDNPFPGPFEIRRNGTRAFKVWPN